MANRYLVALLLPVAAWAQKPASVSGKVTDSLTGAPIPRAHVILRLGRSLRFGAMTDAQGKYSIAGIAAGPYSVSVERNGFTPPPKSGPPELLNLKEGDAKEAFDLQLVPCGEISGRVVDANGDPVQLVSVYAKGAQIGGAADTDNHGRYRIGGLPPGSYRIEAAPPFQNRPPEVRTDGSKEIHYSTTFYPSILSRKEAARVRVAPGGQVSGIDITLLSTPFIRIRGEILGVPAGARNLLVNVSQEENFDEDIEPVVPASKAGAGFVIWGLAPGKYSLSASAEGALGGEIHSGPFDLEVASSDIEHLELRLIPPFEIEGRMVFENDAAKLPANGEKRNTPRLICAGSEGNGCGEAEISADGSFQLKDVDPGRYPLQIVADKALFVRSMQFGSKQIEGDVLDVRDGAGGAQLTLLVSADTAEITGIVSDSKGPAANVPVVMIRGRTITNTGAYTNERGRYVLSGLAPGKYSLMAGDLAWRGRVNPDDYEGIETVEVRAGDRLTQNLGKAVAR